MPMVEDLSVFFNEDEHATLAALDHAQVTGIFSNGPADSLTMTAQVPTYLLPSAACARTAPGSTLRIPGQGNDGLFTVQAIEPDGTGLTLLRLQKARAA